MFSQPRRIRVDSSCGKEGLGRTAGARPTPRIPPMQIRLSYRRIVSVSSVRIAVEKTTRNEYKKRACVYVRPATHTTGPRRAPRGSRRCTCTTTRGCMMYIRHRVRRSGEYAKPVARGRLDPALALFFPALALSSPSSCPNGPPSNRSIRPRCS